MKVIFTNRALSIKPISWINAITRINTKSPFDHVSLFDGSFIYESTSGKGVHKIEYEKWIKDRKNTYIFIYDVDDNYFDLSKFEILKGIKYDYLANFLYLFGFKSLLKRNSNKRIFCSEFVAIIMRLEYSYNYTPEDIENKVNLISNKIEIKKL